MDNKVDYMKKRLKQLLIETNEILVYYKTSLTNLDQIIKYHKYSIETKIENFQTIFKSIDISLKHHSLSLRKLKDYLMQFSIKDDKYKYYIYLKDILVFFDKHNKNLISNYALLLNDDNYDNFIKKWEKYFTNIWYELYSNIEKLDQMLIDYLDE